MNFWSFLAISDTPHYLMSFTLLHLRFIVLITHLTLISTYNTSWSLKLKLCLLSQNQLILKQNKTQSICRDKIFLFPFMSPTPFWFPICSNGSWKIFKTGEGKDKSLNLIRVVLSNALLSFQWEINQIIHKL